MHNCAARCCEDTEASMDSVQGCVQRCSKPVDAAQRLAANECNKTIDNEITFRFKIRAVRTGAGAN